MPFSSNVNKKIILLFGLFYFLGMSFSSWAADLSIDGGYVRETLPGTTISSAYFTIKNQSDSNKVLTGISSSISKRVELHEHSMANGMMKMRQVENITIPANNEVKLQPYGYHVMIFNLEKPLTEGNTIQFTLHFQHHDNVSITLPVQSIRKRQHH